MKIYFLILILFFNFQLSTKADDIRDFEIEGMSIGDSLLDYYSLNKVKSFLQKNQYPSSQRIKMYFIDDKKFIRNVYNVDFLHPDLLINDIKTLLLDNE